MTSTKVVMAGLKWSPLRSFQDKGSHLQVHQECLQDRLETIQSIRQHLPALHLHLDILLAHHGDRPLASQWKDSSHQRNWGKQMSQELQACPHCRRFPPTIMMQMIRVKRHRTLAVHRATAQSTWSKPNSPWSNLPTWWGRPTSASSTSGRKYGWLSLRRKGISQVSRGRTVWNSCEMDPCIGRQQLQIFCWHSRTGNHWIISIMLNGFVGSGWRCFWRNVQAKFGRGGKREGEATIDWRRIWVSMWAKTREVTSQSCQIHRSLLGFAGCPMARIWF